MPDQRYDAGRKTIGTLLSTTSPRIEVPDWQRSYAWNTPQIEIFWQDLLAFDAQYPANNVTGEEYFLGSIVLVTGGPADLLLDGQQRLATATILLSALRDARYAYKADSATRLQNKYISDLDDQSNTTTHVLTLNYYDRDFFRGEIQDQPTSLPARPEPTLKSHALIRAARLYFEARIAEQTEAIGGGEKAFQWNLRIGKVLCDHMSVVAVTSTDEDNAASVFETLNDRGIGLSTPDLLRNLLLRRATNPDSRDRIVTAWQTVLAIDEEVSVDQFLRHYWISQRGDVKARKLYREIKSKVIEEEVDSLVFSRALADAAPLYRDLVGAREDDPELRRLLEGIRLLGAKTVYPALLSGYAAFGDAADKQRLHEFTGALITMFVRYSVIGGKDVNVMESAVFRLAAKLREDRDFDAAIISLADLSPDADDFVFRFERATISRTATARYLLREIEHAMRVTQEVAVEGTDRVHIEHIYPQSPILDPWPNHKAAVNRLGNLTLLSRRLNTSIKNADFATKKANAYSASDILMTQALDSREDWDTAAIEERQAQLAEFAFQIWRFPEEQTPKVLEKVSMNREPSDPGANDGPEALPEVPTG
jgi:hypothetical protein